MLEALLRKEIQEKGPLSQSRFMELALHHPAYGYYRTQEGIGKDFITAPEVSQIFGELIGVWAIDYYKKLGKPETITLVELGPGRGTLMVDFLRVAKLFPPFLQALTLHLIEVNPSLKKIQEINIQHPSIVWHEKFEDIPVSPSPLLIIANEFFDTFPTRCYIRQKNTLYERFVGIEEDRLTFVLKPLRKDEGREEIWEESPAVEASMKEIQIRLLKQCGAFLFFDYGYEKGTGDTLQGLFEGKPSFPLSHVGHSDLTCHVDFGSLKKMALAEKLGVLGPLPQGKFLRNIGLDLRIKTLKHNNPAKWASIETAVERLVHPQQMGLLFKVMTMFSPSSLKPLGFEL